MSKVRAMVVDDSAFMRKVIKNLLEENGTIEVIATARDGKHALEQLEKLAPDVITLDVEMPVMNGLEFLKVLMQTNKIPVVMISSLTSEGAAETFQALELGAVDFIAKPSGAISLDINKLQAEIIEKVENAAKIDMKKLTLKKSYVPTPTPQRERAPINRQPIAQTQLQNPKQIREIVAIGTSTGGPRALQEVLTKIPANFPAPIVIVQHMPPGFTKSLADRLNTLCQIEVVEAEHQQTIRAGVAYIAPGNHHMRLQVQQDGSIQLLLDKDTAPRNGHRPAVDVLYESIAEISYLRKYFVIMTGMGSDGTKGLQIVKEKNKGNAIAVAEHESTCIVYGMPRSAIQMGIVDHIVKLDEIAERLIDLLMK